MLTEYRILDLKFKFCGQLNSFRSNQQKTKMRIAKIIGVIILVLILIYWMGPKPAHPQYTKDLAAVPDNAQQLQEYIATKESQHKLKPDNEARIVWFNDSLKTKTDYAVVYVHGFSAS